MVLHGTWNGLSLFGTAGLVTAYLIMSCVLTALAAVLVADRRRVVRLIERYLPGYTHTGLVTADDIAMLAALRARSAARRWARSAGGLAGARAMADFQLAATELALACGRADRGLLDFNAFAAREHNLLALMAVARHAFTQRAAGGPEPAPAPWAASASAFAPGGGSRRMSLVRPRDRMEPAIIPTGGDTQAALTLGDE
jgi:hypothetical protein